MTDVTQILSQIESGDPSASEQLLPLVYDELRKLAARKLAHEQPGQTLDATALVHEAYVRLVAPAKSDKDGVHWDSQRHFFAAAAEAMRRILIEIARYKKSLKAGGEIRRVELDDAVLAINPVPEDLLALDEALTKLAREDPAAGELAKLRLFAGLSVEQAARSLGMSRTTGFRHWSYARSFLQIELQEVE